MIAQRLLTTMILASLLSWSTPMQGMSVPEAPQFSKTRIILTSFAAACLLSSAGFLVVRGPRNYVAGLCQGRHYAPGSMNDALHRPKKFVHPLERIAIAISGAGAVAFTTAATLVK